MKILPITSVNNDKVSYKGRVGNNAAELFKTVSDRWLKTAQSGKYSEAPIINTCMNASERINNVYLNLSTLMERFCNACELNFVKSNNTGKYRFFIENKYSNYKKVCCDVEFSKDINKLIDVNKFENIESKVAKINPYQENSNFIIQRKTLAKDVIFDREFEPDADYVFIEDKLIKRDMQEATMEDIEEYIKAAKKEGLIDG